MVSGVKKSFFSFSYQLSVSSEKPAAVQRGETAISATVEAFVFQVSGH